jgi:dTDP-glucose 4,6-dehydratase
MAYHRAHGVRTRIVRIFNTYGARMRLNDGRALPNFICQALRGEDLTVFGDGSQTRSFTYVADTLSGILKLLDSDEAEPVNIGNPQEISIAEFARLLIEITGSRSRIVTLPFPPEFKDDPKVRQPDISKARKLLGWEPRYAIRDGLVSTLEYFRKRVER